MAVETEGVRTVGFIATILLVLAAATACAGGGGDGEATALSARLS